MADDKDLETLSDFVHSPGWTWFSDYVTREWGPSGLRYQQAVRDAAQAATAVVELQKVLHTQEQIHQLMRAPAQRLEQLRNQRKVELRIAAPSRRGPGL